MMSATSRRNFLSSAAAAAAAATAAACTSTPPASAPSNTTPPAGPAGGGAPAPVAGGGDIDERVAVDFLVEPRYLDPALDNKPKSSVLLYGLVCVDFIGQQLLVPITAGLGGHGVHQHRSRLWVVNDRIISGTPSGTVVREGKRYAYWDLNNKGVKIEALDGAGTVLGIVSGDLAWRDSPLHPWTDKRWVRCMKDLTNKDPKPGVGSDPASVTSQVAMNKGAVTATPPSTPRGLLTQWRVKKYDNTDMLNATTDSMVWQREYVSAPAKFRISLTSIPTGVPTVIELSPENASLLAGITHAMPHGMSLAAPNQLTDTRAFAQLIPGGDVATHPTPVADRNGIPPVMGSSSDGHCECACN